MIQPPAEAAAPAALCVSCDHVQALHDPDAACCYEYPGGNGPCDCPRFREDPDDAYLERHAELVGTPLWQRV